MVMMLECIGIAVETYYGNIESVLKRTNLGRITLLFVHGGAPPLPDDRNLRPITNSSDIYVKYLFSCDIGSVDKNNFRYCHGGGTKN